ncbi:MAG: VOC family protein, partial [Pseudomonadota bacterium]
MIGNVNIGADDLDAARIFYDAFLLPMGYTVDASEAGLEYLLLSEPKAVDIYITRPFNGAPATAGNSMMIAFEARDQAQVRALHAAGLTSRGSDEGAPGFRAAYSPAFYVGYLRDPQGNKIALFSINPAD